MDFAEYLECCRADYDRAAALARDLSALPAGPLALMNEEETRLALIVADTRHPDKWKGALFDSYGASGHVCGSDRGDVIRQLVVDEYAFHKAVSLEVASDWMRLWNVVEQTAAHWDRMRAHLERMTTTV